MSASALLDGCRRTLDTHGSLHDAATRAKLADSFNAIHRLGGPELAVSLEAVSLTARSLRRALERDLSALLDSALCWNEGEQDCARWAAHAAWRWAAIAGMAADAAPDHPDASAAVGATLAACADSVKWHAIAALPRPPGLLSRAHRVIRLAEDAGFAEAETPIELEGVVLSLRAQPLYLRVLLLDYLASGNLSRQQVEVADAWILRWSRSYALSLVPPTGSAFLRIDRDRGDGLQFGAGEPGPEIRYVSLEELPAQLSAVERGFRAGRIFPDTGISSTFRIENHIAVIDQLRRVLDTLAASETTRRAVRTCVEGGTIELFHGVHEIVERGFMPAPRSPVAAPKYEVAGGSGKRRDLLDSLTCIELPRRWLKVRDASEGGVGLLAARGEHEEVCVGDLVAVREKDGGALAVGEVARRAPYGSAGGSVLGVQIRSRVARPVRLARLQDDPARAPAPVDALFIPGDDSAGRGDAIAVSDAAFAPRARYEIAFDDAAFVVSLNRVRRQGRGWIACGFEVLETRRTA